MNEPARQEAIAASQARALSAAADHALQAVMRQRRPADRALADYLAGHREYGGRDRRLLRECVFAVFRWWGWIEPFGSAAPPAASPALLAAAMVAEAVRADPVLAVLLNAAGAQNTDIDGLYAPATPALRLVALANVLHVPRQPSWQDMTKLTPDWVWTRVACPRPPAELAQWLQDRPPIWLRTRQGLTGRVARELESAAITPTRHAALQSAIGIGHARIDLNTLGSYRDRAFEVQDLASQCVGIVCAPNPGQQWWDVCAGAGGKALHLADLLSGTGRVAATDPDPERLKEAHRRAGMAGLRNLSISRRIPDADSCHGVLVDAPCSGSGTWRRNPWGRWTMAEADIDRHTNRQADILDFAARAVRPAGRLVYATCSFFSAENSDVVERFLDAHPDFVPEPFSHPLTGADVPDGMLQVWPWDGDCDAMFMARFRRKKAT